VTRAFYGLSFPAPDSGIVTVTYPIMFSPNNPKRLYAASQFLLQSDDAGMSWKTISPDLTRNDALTLRDSGGPITHDQNGPEIYGTIFTGPATASGHHSRNVCIFADGEVDRSPTGTGVSATRMGSCRRYHRTNTSSVIVCSRAQSKGTTVVAVSRTWKAE
jgi:hypothetical protein